MDGTLSFLLLEQLLSEPKLTPGNPAGNQSKIIRT